MLTRQNRKKIKSKLSVNEKLGQIGKARLRGPLPQESVGAFYRQEESPEPLEGGAASISLPPVDLMTNMADQRWCSFSLLAVALC